MADLGSTGHQAGLRTAAERQQRTLTGLQELDIGDAG